ncbi:MAG TPA: hypothetical protein VLE73_06825 [Candidatus Saccharimonadales bacterium]|nr:hypothetical protein [Candidatus Saccharimonadales bacterium]
METFQYPNHNGEAHEATPDAVVESKVAAFIDTLDPVVQARYRRDFNTAVTALAAGEPLTATGRNWDDSTVELRVPPQAFTAFIEQADPELQANILYGAEKIAAYEPLREVVDEAVANPVREARGTNVRVVWMEHEGESLVVRDGSNGFLQHKELGTYKASDNIPYDIAIPRLKAVSFNERRMVITEVAGDPVADVPLNERMALPDATLKRVIDDLGRLDAAGLAIDPRHNNLLLEGRHIGFVDLHLKRGTASSLAQEVLAVPDMLTTRDNDASRPDSNSAEGAAADREWGDQYAAFGNRFLDIVEQNYPELIVEAAACQSESNVTTWKGMWGSRFFLNAYALHDTSAAAAFKRRLENLGLAGYGEYEAPTYDGDVTVIG